MSLDASDSRRHRSLALVLLATVVLALAIFGVGASRAGAHAQVIKTSPPADALLAVPPQRIDLSTSERVAAANGSPSIKVLDENGRAIETGSATIDPADPTHISVSVSGIGTGTFTVVWTTTSADDGHELRGTFAFRVGGTDRAPGAVTTQGERPQAWTVVTRWLTFLGAGIAAAAFLFHALGLFGTGLRGNGERRRLLIAAGAAFTGLIATIVEPVFPSRFPGSGSSKSALGDAISALLPAWWLRVPGLAVAVVLALGLLRFRGARKPHSTIAAIGVVAALAAILGLALTTHTAAREHLHILAVASIVLHEWSGALWAGGLVVLGASLLERGDETGADVAIRRFSCFALIAVTITAVAGIVNAVLIFPSVRTVWTSDFGRVLIGKTVLFVGALALAGWHRRAISQAASRLAHALRATIRLEAALVAVVVLGGTLIALLAPPVNEVAGGTAASVDLAAPLATTDGQYVRFELAPARAGVNSMMAFVTRGAPVAYDPTAGAMVEQPAMADVALIRMKLTSLDHDLPPSELDLTSAGNGTFTGSSAQFSVADWWRVDLTVRRLGVEDDTATLFVMLPDPNVNGFDAPTIPSSDPSAESLFQRGLANLVSLHSVHLTERLGGGTGTIVVSDQRFRDASGGQPAAMQITSPGTSIVRMNGEQWIRSGDGAWQHSDSGPVVAFSTWGEDYDGATGFQLGQTAEINGEQAWIISFYVPGTSLAPAWYSWRVGVDSGNILKLTMISRGHYMVRDYLEFNTPQSINPPASDASATPVAALIERGLGAGS